MVDMVCMQISLKTKKSYDTSGKHARTEEGLQNKKDANDYMVAIMIAKGGG